MLNLEKYLNQFKNNITNKVGFIPTRLQKVFKTTIFIINLPTH